VTGSNAVAIMIAISHHSHGAFPAKKRSTACGKGSAAGLRR
jgi:hypothetical protein